MSDDGLIKNNLMKTKKSSKITQKNTFRLMNEIAPKFIFIYENKGALSKSWKIGIKLKLQSRVVS